MLVKIDKERIINTEKITSILPANTVYVLKNNPYDASGFIASPPDELNPTEDDYYILTFDSGHSVSVSPDVVGYLTTILEVNEGYTDTLVELPLKSRLAIFLRNSALPLTFDQLYQLIKAVNPAVTSDEVNFYLNELCNEHVARVQLLEDKTTIGYLHAATGNPFEGEISQEVTTYEPEW